MITTARQYARKNLASQRRRSRRDGRLAQRARTGLASRAAGRFRYGRAGFAALVLASATGCANLPATVRALAADPASVTCRVVTVWGTLDYQRLGGVWATN